MKNLFSKTAVVCLFSIALFACGEDENDPKEPKTPYLKIEETANEQLFSVDAGSRVLTVESNVDWEVSSEQTWCVSEKLAGETDNLKISVTQNPTGASREAVVTLTAQGVASIEIHVTQTDMVVEINVTETAVLVENGDLEFTLEVNSNVPVTFQLPTWIHEAENNVPETGLHTYAFYADGLPANIADQRSGNITVSGGGVTTTIPAIQIQEAVEPGNVLAKTAWIATSVNDVYQDYWGTAGTAIDDDHTSAWLTPEGEPIESPNRPFYMDIDFGGNMELRTITVDARWDIKELKLYTSSDAQNWKYIGKLDYQGGVESEVSTLFINPTQAKYLRLLISESTNEDGRGGIFEVDVTGNDLSGKNYQKFSKAGWTASSPYSHPTYDWSNIASIIDDDPFSCWQSIENPTNEETLYVEVDMKSVKNIAYIGIRERFDCRQLTIEGKTTANGTYTTLGTLTYGTGDLRLQTLVLDRKLPLPQAQFLKISITDSRASGGWGGIFEVDVWGN
ncbi:MAG: hypothetical protein EZS26_002367 [Candidatus Ordinivivax streblomastigis]|uniref:F5/8 type C domain-containing protein n=1 Tax=Candidatus Ordinivivax streblomastigis TaxID=2540710 RepID=A0A5M8NZB4_9BACT|nr:MAG: hypothetical protein EZS26_002367 [Candidatus Ordinivivax streblomastigis]